LDIVLHRTILVFSKNITAARQSIIEGGFYVMNEYSNETTQKYLEAILILSKSKPVVRSVDISRKLNRSKSCVSLTVRNMLDSNLITITDEGYIYLTDTGRSIAEAIYERHEVLNNWLVSIGVDNDTAEKDASRIKHYISDDSLEAIKRIL
jgi:Mn-dependent DtxR family transcriptional regulator